MPENTAPVAKSTIGLKDVVIAKLLTDTDQGTTYDTLQPLAGAIEASITPNSADPDVQYADDGEYDVVNPDPDVSFNLRMADIPLEVREKIQGALIDSNGVLVEKSTDQQPYFAVGFRSEKSDHTYRYVWLLKARATLMSDTFATKEGTSITRQNGEVNFTAIRRNSDNSWRFMADEGQNGFTAQKAATFLSSVYTPSISGT